MDIQKQIEYWRKSSEEDFAAAQSLLEKGHFRHSLFFAHLSIEKMLKAHVVKQTKEMPPKIHDLVRLSQIAELNLEKEKKDYLREFMAYLLEGRYPDSQQIPMNKHFVKSELAGAKEMLKWLKTKLSM
jgi:HEPN domain-containing protein